MSLSSTTLEIARREKASSYLFRVKKRASMEEEHWQFSWQVLHLLKQEVLQ
jgi:hypothetical protein